MEKKMCEITIDNVAVTITEDEIKAFKIVTR